MIKLLTPENNSNVVLLRPRHLEYIANPISDPDAALKIEWLNLKASGQDNSFPLPTKFSFEPKIDGDVVITRRGGETRRCAAKDGEVEITNFYIDAYYDWYVEANGERSETYTFHTDAQAPRMLYVDGISNVRDIGGFYTADGKKRVKQGLLYRTSEMDTHVTITEEGKKTFYELGIRTDLDIRGIKDEFRAPALDTERVEWINVALAA